MVFSVKAKAAALLSAVERREVPAGGSVAGARLLTLTLLRVRHGLR